MVYMKKETSLNLSKSEIGTGNILAVAANIVARFCTGCAARTSSCQFTAFLTNPRQTHLNPGA